METWEKKPDELAENTDKKKGKTPPVYMLPAETPKQSEEPQRPIQKSRQEVPLPPPTKEEAPPQKQKTSEKPDSTVLKPLEKDD